MNDTLLSAGTTALAPGANVAHPFDLDAGLACLDFVNTLRGRRDDVPREFLRTYADLVLFARATGDIHVTTGGGLAALANTQPDAARTALATALDLREALYRIFSAVAAGEQPHEADMDTLNAALVEAAAQSLIIAVEDGFRLVCCEDVALGRPIWSLARAAADLLLSDDRQRLRECAAADCGWIFIDTSRNRSRRWCSMSSCGNRAKVQQFRQRQRGGAEELAGQETTGNCDTRQIVL